MFNSGNNPELVKTSLDEVLFTQFNESSHVGHIGAMDSLFFMQESTDKGSVIYAE